MKNRLYLFLLGSFIVITGILQFTSATPNTFNTSSGSLHSYANNSVLAQGNFYKIRIRDSGIYQLTFEDLLSMGIEPENVRILGYGGAVLTQDFSITKIDDLPEIAIWMEKGQDGVFNEGDYILFYAQGTIQWSYDKSQSIFLHKTNTYSNYGYYFVTSDTGTGKKIEEKLIDIPIEATIYPVDEFTDYQVYELDSINLVNGGKEFYGEVFDEKTAYDFSFLFPNIVGNENSATARLDVAAYSYSRSTFTWKLDGGQTQNLPVNQVSQIDYYAKGNRGTKTASFTPQQDKLIFNLTYDKPKENSKGYLNFIEVNARRKLSVHGAVMQFQNVDSLGQDVYFQYHLANADENIQIWDITNQSDIYRIATEKVDEKIRFTDSAKELRHYLAINPRSKSAFAKPDIIGKIPNQNLHGIQQADMIIITHPDFLHPAETLAQAHREKDGMTVSVLTTDEVYNEFSSGTPDASAYRWVMKMLYDRASASGNKGDIPKYLLLFGKGSFDNRKIRTDSGDNFILTYQADESLHEINAYTTDDYFTYLDDKQGLEPKNNTMDIAVGRFPATTLQQAWDVVDKTISYMENSDKGAWKNQLCFVADDGDRATHMDMADRKAELVMENNPSFYANKLYIDAFPKEKTASGDYSPLLKEKLLSLLDSGLFYLNYSGHSLPQGWASERILTDEDISALDNSHLPFWCSASCLFAKFDGNLTSAAERVILNPNGGGIGVLAAARASYSSQNFFLNSYFLKVLFPKEKGTYISIGEAVKEAKNNMLGDINKLYYILMGDPAIKLNFADKCQILTSAINGNISFGTDTLKANSVNRIRGSVLDEDGNTNVDFNGILHVKIYDKLQSLVTRNNNNFEDEIFEYNDRLLLLSGETQVINGMFEYSFTMPEDLDEDYGKGSIRYYAQDDVRNFEAQDFFDDFIIGGYQTPADVGLIDVSKDFEIINYPNPARDQICFVVNSEDRVQSCIIDIFDISGKTVHTIHANENRIVWDLTNSNGQKLNAGIYYYQASIKTSGKEIYPKSNKIIIVD